MGRRAPGVDARLRRGSCAAIAPARACGSRSGLEETGHAKVEIPSARDGGNRTRLPQNRKASLCARGRWTSGTANTGVKVCLFVIAVEPCRRQL
jgi:hypothetical protein